MQLLRTTTLTAAQERRIDRLWDAEYPRDLAGRYRLLLDGVAAYRHHLLVDDRGALAGWAVEFEKDGEVRFSLIVPEAFGGRGYGTRLLNSLKAERDVLHGWVIDHDRAVKANGAPYRTPLPFYRKNGFEVLGDQRIDTPLIAAVKLKWARPSPPPGTAPPPL